MNSIGASAEGWRGRCRPSSADRRSDEPLLYDKLTPVEYLEFVAGL